MAESRNEPVHVQAAIQQDMPGEQLDYNTELMTVGEPNHDWFTGCQSAQTCMAASWASFGTRDGVLRVCKPGQSECHCSTAALGQCSLLFLYWSASARPGMCVAVQVYPIWLQVSVGQVPSATPCLCLDAA